MQDAGSTLTYASTLTEAEALLKIIKLKETKYRYELLCRKHPEIEEKLVQALLNISDFRRNRKRLFKLTSETYIIFEDAETILYEAIRRVSLRGNYDEVYFLAYNSKEPEKVRQTYQRLIANVFQYLSEIESWKKLTHNYGIDSAYFFSELDAYEEEVDEFRSRVDSTSNEFR